MRIRKFIVAALATLTCLGAAASPALAGGEWAKTGAFRDTTSICLATFPNTCQNVHVVNSDPWSACNYCLIIGQPHVHPNAYAFWEFRMEFNGYSGTRRYSCYFWPAEDTYGNYIGFYGPRQENGANGAYCV